MAIKFLPRQLLSKIAPKKIIKKLVTQDLTLNRTAVSMLQRSGVLTKNKLETIAVKVIRGYRKRYGDERDQGLSKADAVDEALNGKKLMVNRVESAIVHEISKDIKSEFRGEFYIWLPSTADEPDPIHQLNYGKRFQLGRQEDPGERYGCQCGMNILVSETTLKL